MFIKKLKQVAIIIVLLSSFNAFSLDLYPPYRSDRNKESYISSGKNGGVSTAHPLASSAAIKVLKEGGNAIDALVASSFVISVVRPHSTGLGGGGFALVYDNKNSRVKAYDFRERAPIAATRDMYLDKKGQAKDFIYNGVKVDNASINGHLAVATPGLVKGILELHKKQGTLPLKRLLEPAILIAKNGFPVYKSLAKTLERRKDVLWTFEANRKVFFKGKNTLKQGEILIQKDLAKTITLISEKGSSVFYKGEIAKAISKEVQTHKGVLSLNDLKSYETKVRPPIKGIYRKHEIFSMPPPSSGGVHIVQMLNILEDKKITQYPPQSTQYINLLAETMKYAYADRAKYLGDPDFVTVPTKGLTDKKYAKVIASKIIPGAVTPAKKIKAPNASDYESPSTTHISIVDKFGNAVSSTQTINYSFGSCVMVPGYGIILNDEMDDFSKKPGVPNIFGLLGSKANEIQAKKTMLSSMTPTIVLQNKKPKLVVGAPGGSRIINAVLQTILLNIGYNLPLEKSVHAFRVHNQWMPDKLFIEKDSLPKKVLKSLKEIGYKIEQSSFYIGDIQAIAREKEGWKAVSDTRSDGMPMTY